jgi:hypothetical protein
VPRPRKNIHIPENNFRKHLTIGVAHAILLVFGGFYAGLLQRYGATKMRPRPRIKFAGPLGSVMRQNFTTALWGGAPYAAPFSSILLSSPFRAPEPPSTGGGGAPFFAHNSLSSPGPTKVWHGTRDLFSGCVLVTRILLLMMENLLILPVSRGELKIGGAGNQTMAARRHRVGLGDS